MGKYRTAALLLLHKLLKQHGRGHEIVFERLLSDEGLQIYQKTSDGKWAGSEPAAQILITAAQVLFPRDPQALRKLGREEARDNLNSLARKKSGRETVFGVLLVVARLWRIYHDTGRALAFDAAGRHLGMLVVENYPDLPEAHREVFAGFLEEALALLGPGPLQVRRQESDPKAWKWMVVSG